MHRPDIYTDITEYLQRPEHKGRGQRAEGRGYLEDSEEWAQGQKTEDRGIRQWAQGRESRYIPLPLPLTAPQIAAPPHKRADVQPELAPSYK